MPHDSIGLRTLAVISMLVAPTSADSQGSPPVKRFVGAPDVYCTHAPFKDTWAIQTPTASVRQAGKWQANDWVVRQILYPNVKAAVTVYPVTIYANTQVTVEACGCVQTGGIGKTWKHYVSPAGVKADRLYHGVIRIPNARSMGLPISPTLGGDFVRIEDLMRAQRNGFRWRTTTQAVPLALGFEDDGYGDNGYWGHDNGNPAQCQNYQAAAVSVLLQHM